MYSHLSAPGSTSLLSYMKSRCLVNNTIHQFFCPVVRAEHLPGCCVRCSQEKGSGKKDYTSKSNPFVVSITNRFGHSTLKLHHQPGDPLSYRGFLPNPSESAPPPLHSFLAFPSVYCHQKVRPGVSFFQGRGGASGVSFHFRLSIVLRFHFTFVPLILLGKASTPVISALIFHPPTYCT